jgi:hypothetical protein
MGLIRYYSSSVFMWTFNVTARDKKQPSYVEERTTRDGSMLI